MSHFNNIATVVYRMPKYEFENLLGDRSFETCIHSIMSRMLAETVEEKLKLKTDLNSKYDWHTYDEYIEFRGDLAILEVEEYKSLLEKAKKYDQLKGVFVREGAEW